LKSDSAIKAVKADSKQVEKLDPAEKDLQSIKLLRTEKDALLADLKTTRAAAIEANKPPPPVEPLHPSGKTLAEAADMDKIQDLIQSVRPKMMEFDVDGVKKIIDEQPEFRTEFGKTCYAGMKIAAGEALKFKDVLISDINSSPNVPGIMLRTGAPVKGAPAKANVNQILFNTPLGDITLPSQNSITQRPEKNAECGSSSSDATTHSVSIPRGLVPTSMTRCGLIPPANQRRRRFYR
jgi:hypothetical protein